MENNEETLVLVDGSSYLFRAFYAAPPFSTSSGFSTGTIYVFTNMIKSLMKKHSGKRFAVLFDAKGDNFRHEIYPEYKSNRPRTPPELVDQLIVIKDFLHAMGIPVVVWPGVEADDVLGTLSEAASKNGVNVLISTGDKDIAQLVNPYVTIVDTMKNEYFDESSVLNKYGVSPGNIIDLLSLKGDKVDNIPGVDGIGDKVAISLINEFGSLFEIYNNIEKVPGLNIRGSGRVYSLLCDGRDSARISYELATINKNVDLDFSYDDLVLFEKDIDGLISLCEEYELNKWLTEIKSDQAPVSLSVPAKIASKHSEISDFVSKVENNESVSFFSFGDFSDESFMVSLSSKNETILISQKEILASKEDISIALSPLFSSKRKGFLVSYLWKENFHILDLLNINNASNLVSISLLSMIKSFHFNTHTLEGIFQREINESVLNLEKIKDQKTTKKPLQKEELFNILNLTSLFILRSFNSIIDSHPDSVYELSSYMEEDISDLTPLALEHRLERHIYNMENNGVLIDSEKMKSLSSQFQLRMQGVELRCHNIAGEVFNIKSPKEVSRILFDVLKINPVGKKGKSGSYSTKEEVLDKIALEGHEIAQLISDYRSLSKMVTTYVDKLPDLIGESGRLHTTYHQNRTKTGRLSSTDPNLQNIPIKSEDGRLIRSSFIASKGKKIAALDYSQIELRIMAELSKDKALIEAFNLDQDIHAFTASRLNDININDVTESMRRNAKAINFGLIYDISSFGLSKDLNISVKEAQSYINTYFEKHPGVKEYINNSKLETKETCTTQTIGGRSFFYPDAQSNKHMVQQAALRQALNSPLQGTSSEMIKRAIIEISENLIPKHEGKIKLLMQVHDELIFEIDEDISDNIIVEISNIMINSSNLSVPVKVDYNTGKNWSEAH